MPKSTPQKAIIIGSGRGVRSVDSTRSYPASLMREVGGTAVLDWVLSAFRQAGIEDIVFVGGYHIEKVVAQYPNLRFCFDPDWQEQNVLKSLYHVASELNDACMILLRDDIVFREDAVHRITGDGSPISKAGIFKDQETGEYKTGLIGLTSTGVTALSETLQLSSLHGDIEETLNQIGHYLEKVDISNLVSLVHSPADISKFAFGSKAVTLDRLGSLLKEAIILDQVRFTVRDWEQNYDSLCLQIKNTFNNGLVIVRSSAVNEDSHLNSMAGHFQSVGQVPADQPEEIIEAINEVINSYTNSRDPDNEVFIQPYLDQVVHSGVVFTRDPESGSPYLIVNYDTEASIPDSVTSGNSKVQNIAIIYRDTNSLVTLDPYVQKLLKVASELEYLLGNDCLDFEFAFDTDNVCYLLQVRPLIGNRANDQINDEDFTAEFEILKDSLSHVLRTDPVIPGKRTVYSNMSDWNPAELVGVCPRPLGLSIFQFLITDSAWAEARKQIGYADLSAYPLILSHASHPYVDVRASFNSMIPATGINLALRGKLVDHYIQRLLEHPEMHDKVEFSVLITCMDLNFEPQRKRFLRAGFTEQEVDTFSQGLRTLTENIVLQKVCPITDMLSRLDGLKFSREQILARDDNDPIMLARMVRQLLVECRNHGTVPFSILARYAFIAITMLKSLEEIGIFTENEVTLIRQSMRSVVSKMSADFKHLMDNHISRKTFLQKYGHLRPGTYDITFPSYEEDPEFYLAIVDSARKESHEPNPKVANNVFEQHGREIDKVLSRSGFSFSWKELFYFIMNAVPSREEAKLEYTKNISLAFSLITRLGKKMGTDRDSLSFLPIQHILDFATNGVHYFWKSEAARLINKNRKIFNLHSGFHLPNIITSPQDVESFILPRWKPNFTTRKNIMATAIEIKGMVDMDLSGKIVLIESADPGYDWLFTRGIAGLVTKYGGAASHMAIRSMELDLPAAIGCGDLIYDNLKDANMISLDCASQIIKKVR